MTPCVEHSTYGSRVRKPDTRPVIGKRRVYVVLWEAIHGPVDGVLHHLCGNEWCVNVEHLECITQAEHARRHLAERNRNRNRTHCPSGHPYTPENTRTVNSTRDGPYRVCRTCSKAAKKRHRNGKRESSS